VKLCCPRKTVKMFCCLIFLAWVLCLGSILFLKA